MSSLRWSFNQSKNKYKFINKTQIISVSKLDIYTPENMGFVTILYLCRFLNSLTILFKWRLRKDNTRRIKQMKYASEKRVYLKMNHLTPLVSYFWLINSDVENYWNQPRTSHMYYSNDKWFSHSLTCSLNNKVKLNQT